MSEGETVGEDVKAEAATAGMPVVLTVRTIIILLFMVFRLLAV